MENRAFTKEIDLFHGRKAPEKARLVGYGAVIEAFQLPVPLPDTLSLISLKRRNYRSDGWVVHSSKAFFEDTLYKHLVFSLKYEGVDLLFFKKLFEHLETDEVLTLLGIEPTGKYTRKIWFLYEWLMDRQLDKPDYSQKGMKGYAI